MTSGRKEKAKMATIRNAASAAQVSRASWRADDRRGRDRSDLRNILQTPAGRRFLWATLDRCRVFQPLGHDALMVHSNEGRRLVGLELMEDLTAADPNAYLTLLAEAFKAQTLEQAESAAIPSDDEE